ncbi:NTP transferase domain-containing protein [candidate division KSB1 bacterium]|nr:NTP transferase domain-containing protein [candidate division KSB1 bacterium]
MKTNVVAIIIARMTSSRLPGKQMRLINGRPMMYHIVARLNKVKTLDKIVLATASKDENQELAEYVREFGVDTYFDDNENDVTGRIAHTAQFFNASHIVTISGDCPLIHPAFIERGVVQLRQSTADYLYIDKSKYQCLHEGIGFYSTTTWLKLDQLSTTRHHKEHPGSVLFSYEERFHGLEIVPETVFQRHDFRMSVDTMADLDFMDYFYSDLQNGGIVDLYDVINLVDSKPYIKLLNGHVHQRGLTEKSPTIAFITHAGKEIGLGHLSRSIALSLELKESQSLKVVFCVNDDPVTKELLNKNGFVFTTWSLETQLDTITRELLQPNSISAIVLDVKSDKGEWLDHWLNLMKTIELPKFAIDYIPDETESAITSIIPTVCSSGLATHSVSKRNDVIWGRDYLLLNRRIIFWRENQDIEKEGIVVTAGGSGQLADSLLKALSQINEVVKIKFVVGPFADRANFESQLDGNGLQNCEIIFDPPDPYKVYSESQLAIATFGVTAYELIALGVPTVVINTLTPGDRNIVVFMAGKSVCINALAYSSNTEKFVNEIWYLMANQTVRDQLSRRGKSWIDGMGVQRVAEIIMSKVSADNIEDPEACLKVKS